jgi:branched-chain amino acid transport system ATP-binding protein
MTQAATHAIARAGIAYVPEGRGIFPNLSVRENLVMAARAGVDGRREWDFDRVMADLPAPRRTHDQRRRAALRRRAADAHHRPRADDQPDLLILDEATEGLAPLIAREIWNIIKHHPRLRHRHGDRGQELRAR